MSCAGFLKTLHWIFKSCFGLVGTLMIAVGVLMTFISLRVTSDAVMYDHLTILPPLAITAFGIALVLIVTIGCCAIRRPNLCCINVYATSIILLSLIQMVFGAYCIIAYTERAFLISLSNQLNHDLSSSIESYKNDPQPMDNIQSFMKCCGNTNPKEEYNFYYNDLPNHSEFPPSCCSSDTERCSPDSPEGYYSEPCLESILMLIVSSSAVFGYASIVIGGAELVGGLVSVCLSCAWKQY